MARRARDSVAPLRWSSSRLDACQERKVVHWCRTLESSHYSHCVVDGRVDEAGRNTAGPYRSAVFCCWMDQGKGGYSQSCCFSTPARASKQERDAWSQLLRGDSRCRRIRERPVQRDSEIFGFGAKGKEFVVVVDCQLTFGFLVAELEICRHRLCSAELQLPSLEVFTYRCHVLAQHPFHYLPVSINMHDC